MNPAPPGPTAPPTRAAGLLVLAVVLLELVGSGGVLLAGGLGVPFFLELLPWSRALGGVGLVAMGAAALLLARGGHPGAGVARGLLALLLLICALSALGLHPDLPPMGGLVGLISAILPLLLGLAIWRRLGRGLLPASAAGASSGLVYLFVAAGGRSVAVSGGALLLELAALSWLALGLIRSPKAP